MMKVFLYLSLSHSPDNSKEKQQYNRNEKKTMIVMYISSECCVPLFPVFRHFLCSPANNS